MTDKEKLEKIKALADKMYSRMSYLTSDTRPIRQAMDEYHQFIINEYHKEEPVSEELEEAAKKHAVERYKATRDMVLAEKCKWSFKEGAEWKKEKMMAKAVDGDITFDYYGDGDKTYGCIAHDSFCLEDFGLKDRDKVKVIVIKES